MLTKVLQVTRQRSEVWVTDTYIAMRPEQEDEIDLLGNQVPILIHTADFQVVALDDPITVYVTTHWEELISGQTVAISEINPVMEKLVEKHPIWEILRALSDELYRKGAEYIEGSDNHRVWGTVANRVHALEQDIYQYIRKEAEKVFEEEALLPITIEANEVGEST